MSDGNRPKRGRITTLAFFLLGFVLLFVIGVSYTTFDRNPASELDNTREYLVPEGKYFVMADDRDNSADSRVPSVVGYVPLDNFVGPVAWVFSSAQQQAR